MSGANHDAPVDWERLGADCAELAEQIEAGIGEALGLPDKTTSWMHLVGASTLLLARAVSAPGVCDTNREWLHSQLMHLHELWHLADQRGPAAVQDLVRRIEAGEADADVFGPAHCPKNLH